MLRGKSVTVFVASSMPALFVDNLAKTNITINLVLMGKNLLTAYSIIEQKNKNVSIANVPNFFSMQSIYSAYFLVRARILNQEIIFFHECCCPILDICIKIIRPKGHFFPIVNMNALFRLSNFNYYPSDRIKFLLKLTLLGRWFNVFTQPPLGNRLCSDYYLSLKKYPSSIKVHSLKESRLLSKVNIFTPAFTARKKLIFICGQSFFDSMKVIAILELIAEYAIKCGFECFIKDHPNSDYRLYFNYPGITMLESEIAIESLEDNYALAIGVTSYSLSRFGSRSISIVNLIDGLNDSDRLLSLNTLKTYPGSENFYFPESIDEVFEILKTITMNNSNR